jgi:hypothetical protein
MALNFGEGDPSSKKKPLARPYGVALLIAGVDESGPSIYQTDPSGTMVEYKAKGIGAADEGIRTILNDKYNDVLPSIYLENVTPRGRETGVNNSQGNHGGENLEEQC